MNQRYFFLWTVLAVLAYAPHSTATTYEVGPASEHVQMWPTYGWSGNAHLSPFAVFDCIEAPAEPISSKPEIQ